MFFFIACAAEDSDKTPETADTGERGETGTDTDTGLEDGHFFPDGAPWYQEVGDAAVDPDSDLMINALQAAGWGNGRFQIDRSFEILEADAATERLDFVPTEDFYSPDCDREPVPVPEGGNLEGESGYACESDGDCHLLVADRAEARLYEMWRADIRGEDFRGGCLAVWEMDRVYPEDGRGDQCTSADAAGYPIAPLLFSADEVAAGVIDHAIRFILPNSSIRDGVFYHPATHATNSDGGGGEAIPYGARLRLSPDFDMSRIEDPEARVVATALQTYGMLLADGGNIALTSEDDRNSVAKWDDLFDTHALEAIEPRDFEVLELGTPIELTYDCVRNEF